MKVIPSPDDDMVAVVSIRDNKKSDKGTPLSSLSLVNTADKSV